MPGGPIGANTGAPPRRHEIQHHRARCVERPEEQAREHDDERLERERDRRAWERHRDLRRERERADADEDAERASCAESARRERESSCHFPRETESATASPPPRQSVARPVEIAVLQRIQQRGEHAGTARADRMAECDRAAVHVDAIPVPSQPAPSASACDANASFASIRSYSPICVPSFFIRLRTAVIGAKKSSCGLPAPVA